jgi:DNA-binding ferritin-like protein (Dps family)
METHSGSGRPSVPPLLLSSLQALEEGAVQNKEARDVVRTAREQALDLYRRLERIDDARDVSSRDDLRRTLMEAADKLTDDVEEVCILLPELSEQVKLFRNALNDGVKQRLEQASSLGDDSAGTG